MGRWSGNRGPGVALVSGLMFSVRQGKCLPCAILFVASVHTLLKVAFRREDMRLQMCTLGRMWFFALRGRVLSAEFRICEDEDV